MKPTPIELHGATVAITGAGRGIGRATAELFARRGARVAIGDLDLEVAELAAAEIGKGDEKRCALTRMAQRRHDRRIIRGARGGACHSFDQLLEMTLRRLGERLEKPIWMRCRGAREEG